MANNTEKIIKYWRGSRESFNKIINPDYWTRYTVKEIDGRWVEYFGSNRITIMPGQLFPVLDIVENLPANVNTGDRYLVGSGEDYYIVEIMQDVEKSKIMPLGEHSVRVKSKDYMEYQLIPETVNGITKKVLRTPYVAVDCGEY